MEGLAASSCIYGILFWSETPRCPGILIFFFLAMQGSLWDLSSSTRDLIQALGNESVES